MVVASARQKHFVRGGGSRARYHIGLISPRPVRRSLFVGGGAVVIKHRHRRRRQREGKECHGKRNDRGHGRGEQSGRCISIASCNDLTEGYTVSKNQAHAALSQISQWRWSGQSPRWWRRVAAVHSSSLDIIF